MQISVLGGARYKPDDKYYLAAINLGNYFAKHDYNLFAGSGLGIMEAVSCAYKDKPDLLLSVGVNGDELADKCYHWNGFGNYIEVFNIKEQTLVLTEDKDAIFIFPGGAGTIQELFYILSNKIYNHTRIFLVGKELKDLLEFCKITFGEEIFTLKMDKLYFIDNLDEINVNKLESLLKK